MATAYEVDVRVRLPGPVERASLGAGLAERGLGPGATFRIVVEADDLVTVVFVLPAPDASLARRTAVDAVLAAARMAGAELAEDQLDVVARSSS